MKAASNKYKKIVEILRRSSPDLIFPETIENEIMNRIKGENLNAGRMSVIIESLFGWIYIGWVRRGLTAAAVILVAVFIFQQASILNQVRNISEQVVTIGNGAASVPTQNFMKKLTLYKITNSLASDRETRVSEKQLEELINSYDDLLVKYRNLERIIEEDPEIKELIEKRLNDGKNYKPDI
jgi:hypothetical protein